jgi:microcystin-dependent protein
MGAYQVTFTDSNNPAKPPITVADGALNNQTSLTFVGKNYSGYAPIIAGDFLHLLENFANTIAPSNPIQGQLWYDTSSGNNILRVYDGTNWNEAGNLKKAPYANAPSPEISAEGDLWVDTTNSQLYLFSGSQWLLVGPQYSAGSKTGPIVESIVDTQNVSHAVISMYAASSSTAQSYRIAIISKDTFTPKASLSGFSIIKEGINLYSDTLNGDTSTLWGTANSSNALTVGGIVVPAANFLRSDVSSTTNNPFNIRSQGGLSVGTDLSFNISQNSNNFTFYSTNSGNSIEFNVNGSTILHLDPSGNVGIGSNNTNPSSALSVSGVITSGAVGTAGGLIINDNTTPSPNVIFKATLADGLTTSLTSKFTSDVTIAGKLLIDSTTPTGAVILPPTTDGNAIHDIGSLTNPFRNIYAESFVGAFSGNFTGTIIGRLIGSADSLKNPTVFSVAGDIVTSDLGVSFTGQSTTGQAILNTVVSPTMITSKPSATTTSATDSFLVYQSNLSVSKLVNMDKRTFLKDASIYAIPIGAIMPYAGTNSNIPNGWLMCDGSEISQTLYNQLFLVVGYKYGAQSTLKGANTFSLPDLRGRFALGKDDMNNYGSVPSFVQAKDSLGASVSTGGQLGPAGRVSNSASTVLGGSAGNESVVLASNNVPSHTHVVNDPSHKHYISGASKDDNNFSGANSNTQDWGLYADAGTYSSSDPVHPYGRYSAPANTGITVGDVTGTTSQPVTTMNPYLTINYIIFTGVLQ